jgi:hypothetical protein
MRKGIAVPLQPNVATTKSMKLRNFGVNRRSGENRMYIGNDGPS